MNGLYINEIIKQHKNSSKKDREKQFFKLQMPLTQTLDKQFSCFLQQNI